MSVERTLSGVGVGPGDPDHVTVKALRTLETADVILVPSTEARAGGVGRAEEIVCTHLPAKTAAIRRIPFSMAERRGVGQRRASVGGLRHDRHRGIRGRCEAGRIRHRRRRVGVLDVFVPV